jgi:hypothetical protein
MDETLWLSGPKMIFHQKNHTKFKATPGNWK